MFAFGIRNSFGFAFDPRTDRLWQTENGPACNDEVNLIRKGRNYGWGRARPAPGPHRGTRTKMAEAGSTRAPVRADDRHHRHRVLRGVPPGVNERPAGVLRCRERRPDPARHARRATERHPSCPGGVRPSVGRAVGRGPAPVGRCSSATSAPSTGSSEPERRSPRGPSGTRPAVHRSTPGGLERSSPVGIPWCQEHRRESRRDDPHGHRDAETHHRGRADRPARAGETIPEPVQVPEPAQVLERTER